MNNNGTSLLPDLLVQSKGSLIIDIKRIITDNSQTLKGYLDEISKYQGSFTYHGVKLAPEVALLCPPQAAQQFKKQIVTIPIFSYHVDEEIVITPIVGQINDRKISELLSPGLRISQSTALTTNYRMLKSEPPLPYIAEIIYSFLWNNRTEYHKETFKASKSKVNRWMKTLFPPYLKSKSDDYIEQLVPGRVSRALAFLERIGWIVQKDDDIIVYVNKGRKFLDLRKHLISAQAKIDVKETIRHERKIEKEQSMVDQKSRKITEFFNGT